MAEGNWLMFNLDGSNKDPKGYSLEEATKKHLKGATIIRSDSSPDGEEQKWTSWRFSNGCDLRYEGSRITIFVPASNAGKCPTCTQPLPGAQPAA